MFFKLFFMIYPLNSISYFRLKISVLIKDILMDFIDKLNEAFDQAKCPKCGISIAKTSLKTKQCQCGFGIDQPDIKIKDIIKLNI